MSLSILNNQAVTFLQEGRPQEGVSILLEAFERLDLLTTEEEKEDIQSQSTRATSADIHKPLKMCQEHKDDDSAATEACYQKEVASPAMRAHLRLTPSRSIDSNFGFALGLSSVDSDLSDTSANTGRDMNTPGIDTLQMPPGDGKVGAPSESFVEKEEDDSTSSTKEFATKLQSVALPHFHDPSGVSGVHNSSTHDNMFTFFKRAFILTGNEEEDSPKRSSVLLYNMAVAHHNYAISFHHYDRVAAHGEFRMALVFYDMCFNIIQDSWADDEDFLLLLVAVWNNKGHIHAHRCNYLETQEMLTSLQEILDVISSSSLLENPDFLFFYQNLVVYDEQEFASAPAA